MSFQDEQLERVEQGIADVVLDYCRRRLDLGVPEFHMSALLGYVKSKVVAAPSSPDRILRKLRADGKLAYRVVDRGASLYEIEAVLA